MNFLIFRNVCRIFMNFSKFILALFGFVKIKKIEFYRSLTWQLSWWQNGVLPRGDVYTHQVVHVCTQVCMCAHVYN